MPVKESFDQCIAIRPVMGIIFQWTLLLMAYLCVHGIMLPIGTVTFSNSTHHSYQHHFRDFDRNIYHLTSSAEIKVSWEQVINIGRWVVCNRLPLNGVMWYPGGSMKSSRLHHNICSFLYHWVPAFLIDCLLFCIGYPPVYVTQ